MKQQQQGGTILGFILGLVVGLGAAFAVAVYVTKVPVPFLNKGAVRGTEQDAAENEKNKDWDPNAPLYGKNPARPAVVESAPVVAPPSAAEPVAKPSATESKPTPEGAADSKTAPKPETKADSKAEAKPDAKANTSASADPLGDLAKSRANATANATSTADDAFTYFLQTGAFGSQTDAEAQRAKLAMMGWEARVSEREQNGRTVFRVRVGPFGKRGDAEQLKEKLDGAGVDSALVRVQR
ncbi:MULTISPECIES: SPOR domain-containing protein [Giesbergeria]|uniref:SPOR domain-containing protein n=1 Tax=Giesbergeria sinuosa TaxID=80883 RepID=A0ABV9QI08_9BURK